MLGFLYLRLGVLSRLRAGYFVAGVREYIQLAQLVFFYSRFSLDNHVLHFWVPGVRFCVRGCGEALMDIAPAVNMLVEHLDTRRITCRCCCRSVPHLMKQQPTYTATFRQAMILAINGMNVIGLVSIPGMITATSHIVYKPTSALDDGGKGMFEQSVSSLSWHCCILFASHDESQVGRVASPVWRVVKK